MSLVTNTQDLATRIGTEFKAIRVLISGTGTGDVSGLDTTATNLVDAINEVLASGAASQLDDLNDVTLTSPAVGHILRHNGSGQFVNVLGTDYFDAAGAAAAAQAAAIAASQPVDSDLTAIAALTTTSYGRDFLTLANQGALMGLLSAASLTASGIIELATQAEVDTGTDAVRAVTPATLEGKLANYQAAGNYQPLDSDLTAIAALTTTGYGRAFLELADQAALMGLVAAASETVAGKIELATQAEVNTGTDAVRAVTPATLQSKLSGYQAAGSYQPLDSDLTAISALSTTAYGLGFLELANQAALLALIGSASETAQGVVELATTAETTTGTDTTRAVTPAGVAAAIAALVDAAPATLDTLNELAAALGDDPNFATTISNQIAGKQDADATLTALAGLTTAADQMIYSTGADAFAMTSLTSFARTLLDDATAADARTTLSVYSKAEIGDPTTDFVATFEAALE